MNLVRKYMGYCPQFDALDNLLTGKELLVYYAQIRGMTYQDGLKVRQPFLLFFLFLPSCTPISGIFPELFR